MEIEEVIARLRGASDPEGVAGMARYGINPERALGIRIPILRGLAKEIGKNHDLAGKLWESGFHEARILAGMVDQPEKVAENQLENWARDFDSWDVCDQCVMNLFEKTPFAWAKASRWSRAEPEFVKRAGFVLMARLAVSDKQAADEKFLRFLPIIAREAGDSRNFVKKAVNWAIRQIGKRNAVLHRAAVETAHAIIRGQPPNSSVTVTELPPNSTARWIAKDALAELTSDAIIKRVRKSKTVP